MEWDHRNTLLFGEEGRARLRAARVAVFGLGGVGGYVAETLARAGVGALDLIDNDAVSLTNLNRQIFATRNTLGMPKTAAAKERILSIVPDCRVVTHDVFFLPGQTGGIDVSRFCYVADAVDTVTAKIAIAEACRAAGTPLIGCMGTGNKLDPSRLAVCDLFSTTTCPLARVMRRELKKRGFTQYKAVCSAEPPQPALAGEEAGRHVPASAPFVPAAAGVLMAYEIVKDLLRG